MFDQLIRSITEETPGGIGAILMGYDGIAIADYFVPGEVLDQQMVAIEYANVLKEIRNAATVLNTGDLEEVSIRTGRYCFILRAVTEEYFLGLTLLREGNFGKGRYLLRRDLERLREALV